jgi:hypothetical protein
VSAAAAEAAVGLLLHAAGALTERRRGVGVGHTRRGDAAAVVRAGARERGGQALQAGSEKFIVRRICELQGPQVLVDG